MTLITAMKAKDAIIVAADSRGSGMAGGLYNDRQQKLFTVNNLIIGICGAGLSAINLFRLHADKLKGPGLTIESAVGQFAKSVAASYFDHIKILSQAPTVNIVVAGYEDKDGKNQKPSVYVIRNQSQFLPEPYDSDPVILGIVQYAEYLRTKLYFQDMPKELAEILSVRMIDETASVELGVGKKIQLIEATPEAGLRTLGDDEIEKIRVVNFRFDAKTNQAFRELIISPMPQT